MKSKNIFLKLLTSSILLSSSIFSITSIAQPIVKVEKPVFEFGSVAQGVVVEHKFDLQNLGTEPLLVHSIDTTCGCTAAVPPGAAIAPGMTAPVTVAFDTTGFSGKREKSVKVYTNDPKNSDLILTLVGEVQVGVEISPKRVNVGEIRNSDSPVSRLIYVNLPNNSEKKILDVISGSESIAIKEKQITESGGQFQVEFNPTNVKGNFLEKVYIKTSEDSNEEFFVVPITGTVVGSVDIDPKIVAFGMIDNSKNEKLVKSFQISSKSNPDFKVLSVSSSDPLLEAQIKKNNEPVLGEGTYEIEVSLNPSTVKKDLQSTVTVKTNDPIEAEIGVTVYGYLKD